MKVCEYCNREVRQKDNVSCDYTGIKINGKWLRRDRTHFDNQRHCRYCGIKNDMGNTHHYGCPIEICPNCNEQLIYCGCKKEAVCSIKEVKEII